MSDNNQVNVPLLRKAVEWAEASHAAGDGEWDQGWWGRDYSEPNIRARYQAAGFTISECGTSFCIAGYIGQLLDPEHYPAGRNGDGTEGAPFGHVEEFAADALGIGVGGPLKGSLFDGSNTIQDVRRIAEDLAGGPL